MNPAQKKSQLPRGLLASLLVTTFALSALSALPVAAQIGAITADQTAKKQELLGKMQTELSRVDEMPKWASNVTAYAAWQPVASKKQASAALLADRRNDSKKQVTVAMLEADLAAFTADTVVAASVAKSAAMLAEASVPLNEYSKTQRRLIDGAQQQRMQELVKRCDGAVDALAIAQRANLDALTKTVAEVSPIAADCARLPKEFAALYAKGKEFDSLANRVPELAKQHPVLSAIAAFADIQGRHAALRTRVEGIRAQSTSGSALDEPIGLLKAYNRDAQGFADEAQRGGDARTVNVLNTLERNATVFWRAAGCAGTVSGQTFVCHSDSVAAGRSVSYQFKGGTSSRKVGFMAANCTTVETSIGQDAAGADLHVITDGCQIKPESVALSESVQKRTKYVKNNRDKPVEVVFQAYGCGGAYKGTVFVCRNVTIDPGMEVRYEFPLGVTEMNMNWADGICAFNRDEAQVSWMFADGRRGRVVINGDCGTHHY